MPAANAEQLKHHSFCGARNGFVGDGSPSLSMQSRRASNRPSLAASVAARVNAALYGLGYLPQDTRAGDAPYDIIIAQRHQPASTIVTTNGPYREWEQACPAPPASRPSSSASSRTATTLTSMPTLIGVISAALHQPAQPRQHGLMKRDPKAPLLGRSAELAVVIALDRRHP